MWISVIGSGCVKLIEKQTVFVLGAGASLPYDYPTGPDLLNSIIEMIDFNERYFSKKRPNDTKGTVIIKSIHENCTHDVLGKFLNFKKGLDDSSRSSIDTFLENRPEFCDVGKRCIAWNLINKEYMRINSKRDWFEHLHDQELARGCNSVIDYSQNNIDFITFNYDRLLEHNLITRLKGTYGNSNEECAEMIKDSFNIVHVHGKLDDLDWENDDGRAYGQEPKSTEEWKKAASGINIIHEKMGEKPFNEAKKLIEKAELLVFLGLNLHNTINLDRIGVEDNLEGKRIYATLKGLTGPQRADVNRYFKENIVNLSRSISQRRPEVYDYGSLELLQENVRFRG